jgi:hypothetical protein
MRRVIGVAFGSPWRALTTDSGDAQGFENGPVLQSTDDRLHSIDGA